MSDRLCSSVYMAMFNWFDKFMNDMEDTIKLSALPVSFPTCGPVFEQQEAGTILLVN